MNEIEYIEKIDFDQIIQIIHNFPLSTEFFYWLAQNDLENRIIFERIHGGIYERIGEYYIDTLRVFDGGGKFYLDKITESMNIRLSTEKELFYALLPKLRRLEKKTVSEHLNGCYYTVVSDFYYKGKVVVAAGKSMIFRRLFISTKQERLLQSQSTYRV